MAIKAQRAANLEIARERVEEIRRNMIAIRHEQGLLLADLVWNEMKAWEIKSTLKDQTAASSEVGTLKERLSQILAEISRVARWEISADRDYRYYGDELSAFLEDFPTLRNEVEGVDRLLEERNLDSIARAAAIDLELEVNAATGG
jgi:hypothetical protein